MEQGLILDRYRPLAELGAGGHGSVTLAFDTRMARRVAIKRIPLSRSAVERLRHTTGLQEARTAAMLNHPDIVVVHEWDTDDDEAFLIMEHVDGCSLAEVLDAFAPLDLDEAAAVLGSVADAVEYAHVNGVLHLDLKPENVLITREGLVKVADFGVASLTNAAGQAVSAGGTLGYMPPEQLRGGTVDVRTDVWAYGALAFEVLTGSMAFDADTYQSALASAEDEDPPLATSLAPSLAPEVDEILLDALAPAPADRVDSVGDVFDDLVPFMGDRRRGRSALSALVDRLVAEEEGEEPRAALSERLAAAGPLLRRAVYAIAAGWLAWVGLAPLGLGTLPTAAGTVLVAVGGAVAPPLGLAVGLVALVVRAFAAGIVPGLAVLLGSGLWWALVGRRGGWPGVMPVLAPAAGVAGLSIGLPLVAGLLAPTVWEAAAAGAASGIVLVLASFASGGWTPPYLSVSVPALADAVGNLSAPAAGLPTAWALPALLTIAAWSLAAVAARLGARRGSRAGAALGALIGAAIAWLATGPLVTGAQRPGAEALLHYTLSLILVAVVVAIGPVRPGGADSRDQGAR